MSEPREDLRRHRFHNRSATRLPETAVLFKSEIATFNFVLFWDRESIHELYEAIYLIRTSKNTLLKEYLRHVLHDLSRSQEDSESLRWRQVADEVSMLEPTRSLLAIDRRGFGLTSPRTKVAVGQEELPSLTDLLIYSPRSIRESTSQRRNHWDVGS